IDRLTARGFGYRSDGACYFDVSRYPSYGELSRRSRLSMLRKLREEGLLGVVGPNGKRDPLDFVLWRPSEPDEPAWDSEFGAGRRYAVSHAYRSDWSFSWDGLAGTARLVERLAGLVGGGGGGGAGPKGTRPRTGSPDLVAEFRAALDDDLDTPRAVRALRAAL